MNKLQWYQYYREQRLNKKEVWKCIIQHNRGYYISSLGRVRHGDTIILGLNSMGYRSVYIPFKGRIHVHRLVAKSFIDNQNNFNIVNHKNGIKHDNRADNLEWCTAKENVRHAWDNGLMKVHMIGKYSHANHRSKKVNQYNENGDLIKTWICARDIQRSMGIDARNISACCNNKRTKAGGYIWKFA